MDIHANHNYHWSQRKIGIPADGCVEVPSWRDNTLFIQLLRLKSTKNNAILNEITNKLT